MPWESGIANSGVGRFVAWAVGNVLIAHAAPVGIWETRLRRRPPVRDRVRAPVGHRRAIVHRDCHPHRRGPGGWVDGPHPVQAPRGGSPHHSDHPRRVDVADIPGDHHSGRHFHPGHHHRVPKSGHQERGLDGEVGVFDCAGRIRIGRTLRRSGGDLLWALKCAGHGKPVFDGTGLRGWVGVAPRHPIDTGNHKGRDATLRVALSGEKAIGSARCANADPDPAGPGASCFPDSRWPGRVNSPSEVLRPRWRSAPRVLREVVTASSETPEVLSTTEPLATRTPYHPMVPSKTGFPRAGHFSVRRRASPFDSAFPKPVPTRSRIRLRHTVPSRAIGRGTGPWDGHFSVRGQDATFDCPESENERAARQQFVRRTIGRGTRPSRRGIHCPESRRGIHPPGTTSGSVFNQH